MNAEQRRSAKEVFNNALELPPPERDAFLELVCGRDADLKDRVLHLLAVHESSPEFLAEATVNPEGSGSPRDHAEPASASTTLFPTSEFEAPGARVGPYKLLERIGEGGFGTVYLAEQSEPVRRTVATKVIKLGMDTRQVIARFEAERQALAMMDHPHIARVLDAGATESGRPYFVMELVKGVPITQFCDEHRIPLRQRLALFTDVCHAVQHAHQKGIIHRDLKPTNVLVSRHDEKPVVKVIDFGIVKATGARLTDKTLHTEMRQLIGTPTYMSPEQAGMSDLDVDTRSDIYSLGVLLYELLTGATPFDAKSLMESGYDEMRRIIREVEPPKPSTRLSSLSALQMHTEPRAQASGSGSSSSQSLNPLPPRSLSSIPQSLIRSLRGDLDWIVMKCLEKDRTRRYETANALASDVQRHLKGEPVVAAPPSRAYRWSKSLRRHRTAVAVAAGFVVLVGAGLVITGWSWRAESMQRSRAEAINSFLNDMLTAADPARAKGEKLTMREALDKAAQRMDANPMRDQPLVEADIRFTIGSTYWALSLWPQAGAQFHAAAAIQSQELGEEHPDTLRSRFHLARTLMRTDLAGAEKLVHATLETQSRVLGPNHLDTLRSMVCLGVTRAWAGRFSEAEPLLLTAIERRERFLGRDHVETAYFLNRLGETYTGYTYPEKAEPLHREAARIYAQALGEEHPETMKSMEDLAASLSNQYRDEEAEKIFQRLVEQSLRVLGPENPGTLGLQIALADALSGQGRHAEAEPIYREILASQLRVLGPGDFDTITTQRWFAGSLKNQGKYAEAETLLRQALDAARREFGPEHNGTSIPLMSALASVLGKQGKDDEAEHVARQVIQLQHQQRPRAHPAELVQSSSALVDVLQRRGANDEARRVEQDLLDFLIRMASRPDAGSADLCSAAWRLLTTPMESLRDQALGLEFAVKAARGPGASAQHLNFTARHLLTTPKEDLRDPAAALEFALRANELTGYKNYEYLRSLALASFRTGDAPKSIEFQQRALSLLAADAPVRAEYEEQLREFQAASQPADD